MVVTCILRCNTSLIFICSTERTLYSEVSVLTPTHINGGHLHFEMEYISYFRRCLHDLRNRRMYFLHIFFSMISVLFEIRGSRVTYWCFKCGREYWNTKTAGTYACVCCNTPLFRWRAFCYLWTSLSRKTYGKFCSKLWCYLPSQVVR